MAPHTFPSDEFSVNIDKDVHPRDWKNPQPIPLYDILVLGGGPTGMTATTVARAKGATVAVVEKEHFGGECLNCGCIPSKALLRSAGIAADVRDASHFGIKVKGWETDFETVVKRVHRLQATISPHDSAEHFKHMGADVFFGEGRFTGANTLVVGGQTLKFKKAIIATGTLPIPYQVPGLDEGDYFTNQDIFLLRTLPKRLVVIGGGPISCELAQAFLRFGSQVTLITRGATILSKDDPSAAARLQSALENEGMKLKFKAEVARVEKKGKEKIVYLKNQAERIIADEILVAIGRLPTVNGFDLERAGVTCDPKKGIIVNEYQQTANPDIYAAGDVASLYKFTHVAKELAARAVEHALNGNKGPVAPLIVPWCTYTDPEVAHIGLGEEDAKTQGIAVEQATAEFSGVDRAILEEETEGFVKLIVKAGTEQIVGATIVARNAGDMISEVSVAMATDKGLSAILRAIHPFPTQGQAIRAAAVALQKQRKA